MQSGLELGQMLPVAENWCHTQVKVVKFNYMWTINNFSVGGFRPKVSIAKAKNN
jgi:hypothetical protein